MAVPIRIKTPPEQIHDHLQTGMTRTIEVDARALERELHSIQTAATEAQGRGARSLPSQIADEDERR
jgi:hypothetical protein